MFRKKKSRPSSVNVKSTKESRLKKRALILSNYFQHAYDTINFNGHEVPGNIIDSIIQHLTFHDLVNFSSINKATYRYIHHGESNVWRGYLAQIEVFHKDEYRKLKAKHAKILEEDFYRVNSEVLSTVDFGGVELNPLYIYLNLISADGAGTDKSGNSATPKFHFIYNPALFRLQFILIFKALYPLYRQLISSNLQFNNTLFIKKFNNPIQQSILLNNFLKFSKIQRAQLDSKSYNLNLQNLQSVIEFFENACLREIEIGYDNKDFNNKVSYYTNVLLNLNDNLINNNLVNFFLQKLNLNELIVDDADNYFKISDRGDNDLYEINQEAFDAYFAKLYKLLNNQIEIIDQIFSDDKIQLIIKIFEEIIQNYILDFINLLIQKARTLTVMNESVIFSRGHKKSLLANQANLSVTLLPFLYSNFINMITTKITASKNGGPFFKPNLVNLMNLYLETSINDYLTEERGFFKKISEFNVRNWEEKTKAEENEWEKDILKNVKSSNDNSNKNNSFLKLDLVTGFKSILKPINVTFSTSSSRAAKSDESSSAGATANGELETQDEKVLTEFEAKLAIMNNQLIRMKSFFSLDLTMNILNNARISIRRISIFINEINQLYEENEFLLLLDYNKGILKSCKNHIEDIFIEIIGILGEQHVEKGFAKAIGRLKNYNPDDKSTASGTINSGIINSGAINSGTINSSTLNLSGTELHSAQDDNVQPLTVFTELVNMGDLIQNLIDVFYTEELVHKKIINKNQDFLSKVTQSKKKFELMLDDNVANGLNIGIDALINKIQYIYDTYQDTRDYIPDPADKHVRVGAVTACARKTVELLSNHMKLLVGSTEKSTIDVFQQEVSQRFFALIVKNLKTLKINTTGALTLILDLNYYYDFVVTLRQKQILPYFIGLKTVGQIYLIDGSDAKLIGKTISDLNRFNGIFQQEEIYELVQCRADWLRVKKEVEKEMFGIMECIII